MFLSNPLPILDGSSLNWPTIESRILNPVVNNLGASFSIAVNIEPISSFPVLNISFRFFWVVSVFAISETTSTAPLANEGMFLDKAVPKLLIRNIPRSINIGTASVIFLAHSLMNSGPFSPISLNAFFNGSSKCLTARPAKDKAAPIAVIGPIILRAKPPSPNIPLNPAIILLGINDNAWSALTDRNIPAPITGLDIDNNAEPNFGIILTAAPNIPTVLESVLPNNLNGRIKNDVSEDTKLLALIFALIFLLCLLKIPDCFANSALRAFSRLDSNNFLSIYLSNPFWTNASLYTFLASAIAFFLSLNNTFSLIAISLSEIFLFFPSLLFLDNALSYFLFIYSTSFT